MEEKLNGRPNGKFRFERREQTLLLVLGDFVAAMLALGIALLIWARGDTWLGLSIAFYESAFRSGFISCHCFGWS